MPKHEVEKDVFEIERKMPKEIFPSSYLCDCGYEAHFFENTVRELKKMSYKKKIYLADGPKDNEHKIVFFKGEMIAIVCPQNTSTRPRNE